MSASGALDNGCASSSDGVRSLEQLVSPPASLEEQTAVANQSSASASANSTPGQPSPIEHQGPPSGPESAAASLEVIDVLIPGPASLGHHPPSAATMCANATMSLDNSRTTSLGDPHNLAAAGAGQGISWTPPALMPGGLGAPSRSAAGRASAHQVPAAGPAARGLGAPSRSARGKDAAHRVPAAGPAARILGPPRRSSVGEAAAREGGVRKGAQAAQDEPAATGIEQD
jgi:hypothetical protein